MKNVELKFTIALFFFVTYFQAQSILIVGAGETRIITQDDIDMAVEEWRMGDNSTIKFADGVTRWQLRAGRVYFGENVTIDARGKNGVDGTNGAFGGGRTSCHTGNPGGNGTDGTNGGNGVDLDLSFKIYELGSVVFDSSGGNGGDGGNGGKGGTGGKADCDRCDGGKGGTGGKGGNAGNGGNSGKIKIELEFDRSNPIYDIQGLKAFANKGSSGSAGKAGSGGDGGAGKGKCGPWPYWKRGSGHGGSNGSTGSNGVDGRATKPSIKMIF